MSTTVKTGWLNNKNGDKFAPKTLTSQVQTSDGVLLEDKIQADIDEAIANISINVDVDSTLSPTSTNPVQNKIVNAKFEDVDNTINELTTAVNSKLNTVTASSTYETKTDANTKLAEVKVYTDTKTSGLASTSSVNTSINTHNTSTSAHEDIRTLITDLSTAVNNFLDVDDTTTDQLSEVLTLIENNKGTLESLTTTKVNVSDIVNNLTTNSTSKVLSAAQGVAIQGLINDLQTELDSHTHEITDVTGLQTALDGKANEEHGTHVTYNTTAPLMDGTASVGTASTVARSDHRHPTDTSRASQTDLDALETVVAGKADSVHNHVIADVTDLQTTLDGKSDTGHTHTTANITDITATADELNYMSGVTSNVQTQIDGKMSATDPVGTGSFSIGREEGSYVGYNSFAVGQWVTASGANTHAEGLGTIASAMGAHAEGYFSKATASYSHAEGYNTIASSDNQHVQGKYNIDDTTSAHIVGNGTNTTSRSNAHTLDWSGNAWFAGDVYVGSTSGIDKDDGSVKLATTTELTSTLSSAQTYTDQQVATKTQVQICIWEDSD